MALYNQLLQIFKTEKLAAVSIISVLMTINTEVLQKISCI